MDYDKNGKKVRVPVPIRIQKEVLIRSKGKCENRSCGRSLTGIKPNIHHIDKNPKHNEKSNLIVLCPNCHSKKHLNDKVKIKHKRKQTGLFSGMPRY